MALESRSLTSCSALRFASVKGLRLTLSVGASRRFRVSPIPSPVGPQPVCGPIPRPPAPFRSSHSCKYSSFTFMHVHTRPYALLKCPKTDRGNQTAARSRRAKIFPLRNELKNETLCEAQNRRHSRSFTLISVEDRLPALRDIHHARLTAGRPESILSTCHSPSRPRHHASSQ